MGWKECLIPFGVDYADTQIAMSTFSLAAGEPRDFALFGRRDDERSCEVLLLSPVAVKLMGDLVPPTWTEISSPASVGWTLLFGDQRAFETYGLKTPREMGED